MDRKKGIFYGWIMVASSFIIMFLGGATSPSLFFKPMLEEFGWDRSTLSLVGSFSTILMAVVEPFMGGLTDKYGPRIMIIFESTVQGLSRMINGVASNIWHLYIAKSLQVLGFERGTPVLINRWFVKKRGLALSIASAGSAIGQIILVPVTAYMILIYGWRLTYLFWAVAVIIFTLPIAIFMIRDNPEDSGYLPDGENANKADPLEARDASTKVEAKEKTKAIFGKGLLETAKSKSFFLHLAIYFICGIGCGFMTTHFVPFATDVGLSEIAAAFALSLWGAANLFGMLFTGALSDRIGKKNALALAHFFRLFSFFIALIGFNNVWIIYGSYFVRLWLLFTCTHHSRINSRFIQQIYGGINNGIVDDCPLNWLCNWRLYGRSNL